MPKELTPQSSHRSPAVSPLGKIANTRRHDAQTLQKLKYAGTTYGIGAGILFLVAVYFLLQGHTLIVLLTFAPSAILGFMSWHCLRQLQ